MHILILISLPLPPLQVSKTEIDCFAPSLERRCRSIEEGYRRTGRNVSTPHGRHGTKATRCPFPGGTDGDQSKETEDGKGNDIEAAS